MCQDCCCSGSHISHPCSEGEDSKVSQKWAVSPGLEEWPEHKNLCPCPVLPHLCFNHVLGFVAQSEPVLSAEGRWGFGAWADFWRYISKLKIPQVWRPPKCFLLVDVFILNKAKAAQFSVPCAVGLEKSSKGWEGAKTFAQCRCVTLGGKKVNYSENVFW